jgi:hypothetical protein
MLNLAILSLPLEWSERYMREETCIEEMVGKVCEGEDAPRGIIGPHGVAGWRADHISGARSTGCRKRPKNGERKERQ